MSKREHNNDGNRGDGGNRRDHLGAIASPSLPVDPAKGNVAVNFCVVSHRGTTQHPADTAVNQKA
jgi:hypothetical protein